LLIVGAGISISPAQTGLPSKRICRVVVEIERLVSAEREKTFVRLDNL